MFGERALEGEFQDKILQGLEASSPNSKVFTLPLEVANAVRV